MFQRLLVGIDDSDQREITLSFAMAVARQCGSTVHLCLVNPVPVGSRGLAVLSAAEANEVVADGMRQLRSEGIPATGSVRRTLAHRVADCLVASASELSADAIVIGSRRRRRLHRVLSSGVRERTIRLTCLPVLTAPAPLALPGRSRFERHDVVRALYPRAQTRSE
jgi:nucleotide-binding universal stress UspA family protein